MVVYITKIGMPLFHFDLIAVAMASELQEEWNKGGEKTDWSGQTETEGRCN